MMTDSEKHRHGVPAATVPRITIPAYVKPTAEERARLQELIAKINRHREQIGPIGMNAVDLIDADFYDIDPNGR
jgi:hypothetical protein